MLVMPTRGFMFDNYATLDSFHDAVSQRSAAEMIPAGTISVGTEGKQQSPYNTLAARGVSILTDGDNVPDNLLMLHRAMKYAAELNLTFAIRGDVPMLSANTYMHPGTTSYALGLHGTPACAEEIGIETLIRLAKDAGARLHIQTVSTAEGADIIRRAKSAGMKGLTAEVALHHLLYTHEDVGDYDTTFKTLPPLRDKSDCEALLQGVKDGTIDQYGISAIVFVIPQSTYIIPIYM
jgi:dihydroorotase